MAGISRYARTVIFLAAGFALFCGGRFSAQLSRAEPWQVTAGRRPPLSSDISAEEDEGVEYPDSLLPGETININRADVYDLQRLPGIGEKRAKDIIAYRAEHGPFQTVDQLVEISGIGPGILEGLRDYVNTEDE